MPDTPQLWLTTGEPAGIGPDISLSLANSPLATKVVLVGDPQLLAMRAKQLGKQVELLTWEPGRTSTPQPGQLRVRPVALRVPSVSGRLDPRNADYVIETLQVALDATRNGLASGIVTAPVQKSVIADSGYPFTGHTEFFAKGCGNVQPVMMLLTGELRVALATTHLPLRQVPGAITRTNLLRTFEIVNHDLKKRFGIAAPNIHVCGLNPHAGENGHLGREEIEVITPTIETARGTGMQISGPWPADTAFTPQRWRSADVVVAMYHDQGLAPLKYAGFGHAVNVTLGLPIIRTSVDHGTALDLAGTGKASAQSLRDAVQLAAAMAARDRAAA